MLKNIKSIDLSIIDIVHISERRILNLGMMILSLGLRISTHATSYLVCGKSSPDLNTSVKGLGSIPGTDLG